MKGLQNHLLHYSVLSAVETKDVIHFTFYFWWFLSHSSSPQDYLHAWFPMKKEEKIKIKALSFLSSYFWSEFMKCFYSPTALGQKYLFFFETTSLVWGLWAAWRCPFRFALVEARYSDLTQTEKDKLLWQKQEGEWQGCSLLTCFKNNTDVKPEDTVTHIIGINQLNGWGVCSTPGPRNCRGTCRAQHAVHSLAIGKGISNLLLAFGR